MKLVLLVGSERLVNRGIIYVHSDSCEIKHISECEYNALSNEVQILIERSAGFVKIGRTKGFLRLFRKFRIEFAFRDSCISGTVYASNERDVAIKCYKLVRDNMKG